MNKPINFVIYGCGMIANIHAISIGDTPGAVLYGACDKNIKAAKRFSEKYGVHHFETFEDVLSCNDVDAVSICTPSGTHASLCVMALNAGKNVVVEKPMAINVEQCDEIIEACERSRCKLSVISQLRTNPDILMAKEIVESGALGKIVLCDLYMKYYRSTEYYNSSWRGTRAMDGGGALMNQGIHGIDLLQYIVGPIKNVKSFVKTLCHNIEVEDTAVSVAEFENGAVGVIEASTAVYPGFNRKIEINGSRGTLVLTENQISKLVIEGDEVQLKDVERRQGASDASKLDTAEHTNQYINIVNAFFGKEPLLVDHIEGKKAVEIICNIYKDI